MKNCDRGLESLRSQFFTIRTDLKPVNNLFIFFQALKRKKSPLREIHASVTVTVVRDRKIRTALRTNQIVGFVTVPAWKKITRPSLRASVTCKRNKLLLF